MDFVSDQLSNDRRFLILNVVDDDSREIVGWIVSFSFSGQHVALLLTQLGEELGFPDQVICDNGTEFTSKAVFFWQKEIRTKLGYIQPGKPTQNAFAESLNGKFINEFFKASMISLNRWIPKRNRSLETSPQPMKGHTTP